MPVSTFLMLTSTPGTAAPLWSVTLPDMVPVSSCAIAKAAQSRNGNRKIPALSLDLPQTATTDERSECKPARAKPVIDWLRDDLLAIISSPPFCFFKVYGLRLFVNVSIRLCHLWRGGAGNPLV